VSQGANAIENDIQFNDDGHPSVVEHRKVCDCICAFTTGHICPYGLGRKCAGPSASNDASAQIQHIARLGGVALYIVDSKVEANWEKSTC
jgi:hypothetical protein